MTPRKAEALEVIMVLIVAIVTMLLVVHCSATCAAGLI